MAADPQERDERYGEVDAKKPPEGIFSRPIPQVAERNVGRKGGGTDPRDGDEMFLGKDIVTIRLEFFRL